jgi:3'-phosphoadenosine 5'-phosphosulfate sulfotransferase (PAPS reductase)/FAD synthetase
VKTVLQLSGGKDSLACLYLCKPDWDSLTVAWVNAGAAFPETLEQMQEIRELVPHFLEVKSTQTIERDGYPVDVLPIASSVVGRQIEATRRFKYQSRIACCAASLWFPMHKAMRELGAEVVIRGQKACDRKKSPIRSGDTVDGIRYLFPIDDWTDAQVMKYLETVGARIPENYRYMNTGLDCWNCTAYLDENVGKFDYMREHHTEKHAHVLGVLAELDEVIGRDLEPLKKIRTGIPASPTPPIAGERGLRAPGNFAMNGAQALPGVPGARTVSPQALAPLLSQYRAGMR